jgi:GT2 family glycosyltransferase
MTGDARQAPVSIIVLNYDGREHLAYCLPSILATDYSSLSVIVVDNGSSDDSAAYVRAAFPQVVVLRSETNRGWSGGNNLGIEHARRSGAEFVVLANNDIRVDARWVSAAVSAAQRDPLIGIVGFRIIEPRGTDEDAGFQRAIAEWPGLELEDARWVNGMAMFVRTALFSEIGLIDEGFFAYAEDNDFERRARKAGYRVVGINVPIWHRGQGTFGKTPLRAASLQVRNNLRLSLKHDSPLQFVYQLMRHFAKGCLPWVRIDPSDPVARRLRPSNIAVNFGILIYAVTWNIWHLPATLRRRQEDERRAQAARRRLGLT